MHHPSVLLHVIPMKFSRRNIWFRQKEPIKVQFFRLWSALMEVYPIPHAIFESTRSRFIQILRHCSTGSCSTWEGGKRLTLGKEGFAWGTRSRGKLYRFTIKWTSSKTGVKDFPYTLKVPPIDCFKSIASHIFLKNWLFFGSLSWDLTLLYFFYALDKTSRSKCKFSDFRLLAWK